MKVNLSETGPWPLIIGHNVTYTDEWHSPHFVSMNSDSRFDSFLKNLRIRNRFVLFDLEQHRFVALMLLATSTFVVRAPLNEFLSSNMVLQVALKRLVAIMIQHRARRRCFSTDRLSSALLQLLVYFQPWLFLFSSYHAALTDSSQLFLALIKSL